ncbi:MAG: zf-HC2 domain-containing protein [Blautia sp.]|nr:zf-HC2 domain-containing protein [Blautia sp.]
MDCRNAEAKIDSYIGHRLSLREIEEFLEHVQSCPSCYDELETHFIVDRVIHQLDHEKDTDHYNYQKLLQEDIHNSLEYVHNEKKKRSLRGFAKILGWLILSGLVLALIVLIYQNGGGLI